MINQKKLLYIECGVTSRTSINTGIQRVVRNIIGEATQVAPPMGYEIVLVEFLGGTFKIIDETKAPESVLKTPIWIRVSAAIYRRILWLSKFIVFLHLRRFAKYLINNYLIKKNTKSHALRPIGTDGKSSMLILLDSNWDNSIWPEVDEFRKNGGKVCAVLYDLIPFTHPDTVADSTRIAHTSWWYEAPQHIDLVMCISNAVREDFLDWQKRMALLVPIKDQRVGYFHLGAELTTTDSVINLLSDNEPYFLMVGSLEPRKNHKIVLDAFDRLWQEGRQLRLAIVGAYGWKSEALLSRIREHPLFNQKLFLIRDATDRDLVSLYVGAEALIIASIAEGFGLPIIEAQQLNCKVICSDIPVFREVASNELAVFFNPLEKESLVDIINEKSESGRSRSVSKDGKDFLTWRQSVKQLLSRIDEIAQ